MSEGAGLPEGWSNERISTASLEEINALPAEDFARIQRYIGNQTRFLLANRNVTESSIPPPAPFVFALQKTGLLGCAWGFVVFRQDYKNVTNDDWNEFTKAFATELHNDVTFNSGQWAEDEDAAEARSGLTILWIEDDEERSHQGTIRSLDEMRAEYGRMKEQGEIPDGLDHGAFFVADSQALASTTRSIIANGERANMLVVDAGWSLQDEERDEDRYKGYFRATTSGLLTDLFPLLCMGALTPKELAMMIDEDEVWSGIG